MSLYRHYGSDLADTTRLFGGINPKTELSSYISQHGPTNVLEIGCGEGRTLSALEHVPGATLFGTNLSHEVSHNTINAKIRICHLGQLSKKFQKESIGFAYASIVFDYVPDIQTALQELSKLMKAGGIFIVNQSESHQNKLTENQLKAHGFEIMRTTYSTEQATDPFTKKQVPIEIRTFYTRKIPEKINLRQSEKPQSRIEWFRKRYGA